MLYTLALSRVKTRLVLRSSSLKPSKISVVGALARLSSTEANYQEGEGTSVSYIIPACFQPRDWGGLGGGIARLCEMKGGGGGWRGRLRPTFFIFSANRSYSSRTSCSNGESSGGERSALDALCSILLRLGPSLSCYWHDKRINGGADSERSCIFRVGNATSGCSYLTVDKSVVSVQCFSTTRSWLELHFFQAHQPQSKPPKPCTN